MSVWESVTCGEVPWEASRGGVSDPLELEVTTNCKLSSVDAGDQWANEFPSSGESVKLFTTEPPYLPFFWFSSNSRIKPSTKTQQRTTKTGIALRYLRKVEMEKWSLHETWEFYYEIWGYLRGLTMFKSRATPKCLQAENPSAWSNGHEQYTYLHCPIFKTYFMSS